MYKPGSIEFEIVGDNELIITKSKSLEIRAIRRNFLNRNFWIEYTLKNISRENDGNTCRYRCELCYTTWKDMDEEFIHILFPKSGTNKMICTNCLKHLEDSGIPSLLVRISTRESQT